MKALDHARALSVLLVGAWMLVLGLPKAGGPWRPAHDAVIEALTWTQRPLRIAQQWSLYGVGPNRTRRLRILADDELLYRSGERHHPGSATLYPLLRYRRVRPIVVGICTRDHENGARLLRYLVREVRTLRPDVRQIQFQCTSSRWPGLDPRVGKQWTASVDAGWHLRAL